jgi:p-aminobenzoyl-glutamate transporter AbgT
VKQRLIKNNSAVSNVLAYLFSFTIATMIMIASVYITRNMIDNKTAEVAGIEAQSVANRVANAILEIASSSQTSSGLNYKKTLNLPETLAGLIYYIEVNDHAVFVNTTNGFVKKSCPI